MLRWREVTNLEIKPLLNRAARVGHDLVELVRMSCESQSHRACESPMADWRLILIFLRTSRLFILCMCHT